MATDICVPAGVSGAVAVIGLGYVGLPVAAAFAGAGVRVIGFDHDEDRVGELLAGRDRTGEVAASALSVAGLALTSSPERLAEARVFIIAVPTPVGADLRPDLSFLTRACALVGAALAPGALVVLESTVYPGVTEDVCGPCLARASGLRQGTDFRLAYSPERINVGDRAHGLGAVVKVVAGQDEATTREVAALYERIVPAGVFCAASIRVAEAAKAVENVQRDVNIALMNELAQVFDRIGISTRDVLDAARTKWNFLPFTPGLVGGHCIGVDPYYLIALAEETGYSPAMMAAARRVNEGAAEFVARKLLALLEERGIAAAGARIGVLGLAFKEDVRDLRNSRVPDVVSVLAAAGAEVLICDPLASPVQAQRLHGIALADEDALQELDGLVLAVPHRCWREAGAALAARVKPGGVLVDVKAALNPAEVPEGVLYWSL